MRTSERWTGMSQPPEQPKDAERAEEPAPKETAPPKGTREMREMRQWREAAKEKRAIRDRIRTELERDLEEKMRDKRLKELNERVIPDLEEELGNLHKMVVALETEDAEGAARIGREMLERIEAQLTDLQLERSTLLQRGELGSPKVPKDVARAIAGVAPTELPPEMSADQQAASVAPTEYAPPIDDDMAGA